MGYGMSIRMLGWECVLSYVQITMHLQEMTRTTMRFKVLNVELLPKIVVPLNGKLFQLKSLVKGENLQQLLIGMKA
ncbi:hypothetical protein VIGAN_04269500 [Vigna angularis var. angularis]|uniref:Uncharacterized protein n=1 Tax=Vigna angularis var. angularis TaxID=157739 RepID=A0A0S3RX57_PHAAN|nr:hypothetical protein VIGAN_04269500 [Vigna angularis var. angularis]